MTTDFIDTVVETFSEQDQQLAAFDTEERRESFEEKLVNIIQIDKTFREYPELERDEGKLVIPLHEKESAELTGEYIVSHPNHLVSCVFCNDFSGENRRRIRTDSFEKTMVAYRTRFWSPNCDPPHPPSYHSESESTRESSHSESRENSLLQSGQAVEIEPVREHGEDSSRTFLNRVFDDINRERNAARKTIDQQYEEDGLDGFRNQRGTVTDLFPPSRNINFGDDQFLLRLPPEDRGEDVDIDIPDEYGVYPGNEVLVNVEGHDGPPMVASVAGCESNRIVLEPDWTTAEGHEIAHVLSSVWTSVAVITRLNPVTFERQENAVSTALDRPDASSVLLGQEPLEFDTLSETSDIVDLNEYQELAAQNGHRARSVLCIHGPPGTGKTRTLSAFVRQAVGRGKKVLVTAHSNQAVDNLIAEDSTLANPAPDSLHQASLENELEIARIGRNCDNEVIAEHYLCASPEDARSSDVVAATTSTAARLPEREFDIAVVDEATQASIPSTLIPYTRADQLILAGDSQQLPPYTGEKTTADGEVLTSLFEHLLEVYGSDLAIMLRRQYRMNAAIASFSDSQYYAGQLEHAERNADWTVDGLEPLLGVHVSESDRRNPNDSSYNEAEAQVVAEEVEKALNHDISPEDIGVITPYKGQINVIKAQLGTLGATTSNIKIDTIDSFQGGEREVVIVSWVRSNENNTGGFLEYPDIGPRRLNVALTRARKRCVLIGNWATLSTVASHLTPETSCADHYAALADHLEKEATFVQSAVQTQ